MISMLPIKAGSDFEEKFEIFFDVSREYLTGSVLDVGCRDCLLSQYIDDYVGLDIEPKPYRDDIRDIIKCNLEYGIPFKNNSFDTVLALDVLEHVDNLYYLFNELKRVSKKYIIINLPNLYHFKFRLKYVFGKSIGGKYGIPIKKPPDRHKWIFNLNEARDFLIKNSFPFKIQKEYIWSGGEQYIPLKMVALRPNLFGWRYQCILEKKNSKR